MTAARSSGGCPNSVSRWSMRATLHRSPSTSRGQFQAAASSSSSSRSRRARRRGAYAGVVTNLAQVE